MRVVRILLVTVVFFLGGMECRRPNRTPVVSGPPVGTGIAIQDTSYLFMVAASDEDGDSVCCRVDWGDGDTSAWCSPVASDSPACFSHSWDSAGTFEIRNQARDARGAMSAWSDPAVVAVRDSHPVVWFFVSNNCDLSLLVLPDGDGEMIYTTAYDRVYAIDGEGVIRYVGHSVDTLGNGEFSASPAYCAATDHIIVGNDEGELYAFTRTLEVAWHWPGNSSRYTFDGRDWGTPVVRGNLIYAVRDDGQSDYRYICCFRDLGDQVALVELDSLPDPDECIEQPPAIDAEGNLLVVSTEGYLYKFTPALDSLLWQTFVGDGELLSPVVGPDGAVYCSSPDEDILYALEPGGSFRWSVVVPEPGLSVIGESLLFVGSEDGTITALRLGDGEVKWTRILGSYATNSASPLLVSNGVVCFLDDANICLWGVSQIDGAVQWVTDVYPDSLHLPRRDFEESYPAPSLATNGDILVPTQWGVVRVQGYLGTTLAATPWPKWQHDVYNSGWAGQP